MNGNGSHPNHENCEGMTGIRNRLLRGRGRSIQVIEAPRGRPFGGGASHRMNKEWPLPKLLCNFHRNPEVFNKIVRTWLRRGRCLSTRTAPCALRLCRNTFSGVMLQGVPQAGAEAFTCRSPQKAFRKIFSGFPLNLLLLYR